MRIWPLLLLVAMPLPVKAELFAVQGRADSTRSKLVRLEGTKIDPLTTFEHATGWLPSIRVDGGKALATIVPVGARFGQDADLYLIDLKTQTRTLVEKGVPPRQTGLFGKADVFYVRRRAERLELVRRNLKNAKPQVMLTRGVDLLWPLAIQGKELYLLEIGSGRARLIALPIHVGQPELRVVRDFGTRVVRDFSFGAGHVVHQVQRGPNHFTVERTALVDGRYRTLFSSAKPWLAPMRTEAGVLVSDAESGVRGRLLHIVAGETTHVRGLGQGVPIPLAVAGNRVFVRLQTATEQRFHWVDLAGGKARRVGRDGELFEVTP